MVKFKHGRCIITIVVSVYGFYDETASLAREVEHGVRSGVLFRVRVLQVSAYLQMPPVLHRVSPSVFRSRRMVVLVHADE